MIIPVPIYGMGIYFFKTLNGNYYYCVYGEKKIGVSSTLGKNQSENVYWQQTQNNQKICIIASAVLLNN